MNKLFASLALFALTFAVLPAPAVHAATTVHAGDLIRGESFSAVYYYGEDGFRYVFPNEKTYFTWYSNFDDVVMLTDTELGKIQIGGNVTYKPSERMVKIQSDPTVYVVEERAELRKIASEAEAALLYGADWQGDIDDIPDAFFGNYTISDVMANGSRPLLQNGYTITDDKGLTAFTIVGMYMSMFTDSPIIIAAGATIMFINFDNTKHTATADDNSWGTGTMNYSDTFVRRFDTPGTYTFHCSYHTEMTGTIIVE